MTKSTIEISKQFLASGKDDLDELRIHEFKSDEEAHDDSAIDRLHAEFVSDFERVQTELSATYGAPLRKGTDHDEDIPISGVFRFAVWEVEGRLLYVAVAHEDRECPILLILGTASQ